MKRQPDREPHTPADWDAMYREGTPPWETGRPAAELIRVLDEGVVPSGTTLEVGCGTGADAVCLARRGLEVTAVDWSPQALERARRRAAMASAAVRFVRDDVFEFVRTVQPFDFVYDAGFYHFVRRTDLTRYLDLLWRTTRPGSFYLALAGSTGEKAQGGPPQVSQEEIRSELGRMLEFIYVRHFRLESPNRKQGYLGWSCLLKRPHVVH